MTTTPRVRSCVRLGEIWESRTRSNAHERGRSSLNPLAANPLKRREYAVAGLLPGTDR
jgi:hypothetical protein